MPSPSWWPTANAPSGCVARPSSARETRHRERRHKHGSLRFVLLIVVLLATAVGVTLAMFQALFLVVG